MHVILAYTNVKLCRWLGSATYTTLVCHDHIQVCMIQPCLSSVVANISQFGSKGYCHAFEGWAKLGWTHRQSTVSNNPALENMNCIRPLRIYLISFRHVRIMTQSLTSRRYTKQKSRLQQHYIYKCMDMYTSAKSEFGEHIVWSLMFGNRQPHHIL